MRSVMSRSHGQVLAATTQQRPHGHRQSPIHGPAGPGAYYGQPVPVTPPTVLVVDDSDTIRSLIVLNLELDGFTVVQARDGQECLDVVKDVAPDLITLDVAMPRRDGFSTVEMLRADPDTRHIPIVMVSARAQGSDLARGQEVGVDAYLTKPFEPEELVATVRSLVADGGRGR